jgi:hypothetical protein
MASFRKRLPTLIFWVEIFFWLMIAYFGRDFLDRYIAFLSSAWLAWLIRILFLVILMGVAIFFHGQLDRFLKSRGMIE